ncbi:MAG TPA: hypothetical protein VFQ07_11925 [Candidatus Polarisedimenticolia bacterium]|nr:hypothetical protein [Candidatus Polarisedimenticolia bacterium]
MRPESRRIASLFAGAAGLALFAGFMGGWAAGGGLKSALVFPPPAGHEGSASVRLSVAGERVASGLKCPCGCPDLLLACDCQNTRGAAEVKRVIMDLLANGRSESEARIELLNKYGAAIQRVGR